MIGGPEIHRNLFIPGERLAVTILNEVLP